MVVYLYKKGRQTMKNIITTIAMFILTITAQAQDRVYLNVGQNLRSVLDSNNIFYVGMLDRKNLGEGKKSYVNKNIKSLDTFELFYNNDDFKTIPDTNNVIMSEKEFLSDKNFSEMEELANSFFSNKTNIIGYKHFETPNSNIYKKIVVYEVEIKFGQRWVQTQSIGQKENGVWVNIPNW